MEDKNRQELNLDHMGKITGGQNMILDAYVCPENFNGPHEWKNGRCIFCGGFRQAKTPDRNA